MIDSPSGLTRLLISSTRSLLPLAIPLVRQVTAARLVTCLSPHVDFQVFPPTKIIFSGLGILLVAAKSTVANRDVLVKLFDRIQTFFERLRIYTNVPPSPAMTDALAKIMAEVLSILAIATKGMKEKRIKTFFKKVAGMNGLEDALQRFGELEQRELLTGIAQVSSDTSVLKDGV
ncbi:hypothetical protein EDB87DRAFT_1660022 [Lactarius vividus]|nr:hypothetical protein EDB87DRAFT_1660022 [Lactarius vividus]